MKYGRLILTQRDLDLLKVILVNWNMSSELSAINYNSLTQELKNASIVDEKEFPKDVVKFHSNFDVQTPFGILKDCELVTPSKRNPHQRKLSILSPIGSAVLGYAEGDKVKWDFPIGEETIRIIKVNN